jgi:hypothetical protein
MKLVFNQTGDTLLIDPCKNKIVQTWIDSVTTDNSLFTATVYYAKIHQMLDNLLSALDIVNQFLDCVKIAKFTVQKSIDQSYLNLLHKQWVSKISKHPNLGNLCSLKGIDYSLINELVHQIETYFKYVRLESKTYKTFVPNRHDIEEVLTLDKYQISIHYDNLGRDTYNQWYVDSEPDSETNNFNIVTTRAVDILLEKFYTVTTPSEYQTWCQQHKLPALGNILPIGNFRNYYINVLDL